MTAVADPQLDTAQPDEPTEPTADPSDPTLTTFDRVVEVMREIHAIGKEGEFKKDGQVVYKFRSVDAVMQAVAPLLRKWRILPIPEVTAVVQKDYPTKGGGRMLATVVDVTYHLTGPNGDVMPVPMKGEAADYGDKGLAKACSVAYRVMWCQLLCIPTADMPDPDLTNFEIGDAYREEGEPSQERRDRGRGRQTRRNDVAGEKDLHDNLVRQLATAIEAVRTLRGETVEQSNKRAADYCQTRHETNIVKRANAETGMIEELELRRLSLQACKIFLGSVNKSIKEIEDHRANVEAESLAQRQEV